MNGVLQLEWSLRKPSIIMFTRIKGCTMAKVRPAALEVRATLTFHLALGQTNPCLRLKINSTLLVSSVYSTNLNQRLLEIWSWNQAIWLCGPVMMRHLFCLAVMFLWLTDASWAALCSSSDVDNPASDLLLRASCSVSNRIIHAASFSWPPFESLNSYMRKVTPREHVGRV